LSAPTYSPMGVRLPPKIKTSRDMISDMPFYSTKSDTRESRKE
jgi:hypothetical protein